MTAEQDEFESLIPALVLGALDDEEAERVRVHLEGCESCRALVARLARAVDAMQLAVGDIAPPAGLRARILDAAAGSRPAAAAAAPQRANLLELPRRRPPRSSWVGRFAPAAAAAALVAFALGAGLGLGVGRTIAPAPAPATVAQYSMTGSGAMTGANGQVYELRQQGLTLIQFTGLPQPDAGKIYELWLIPDNGQPVAAAVFTPDLGGEHVAVLARTLHGFKAVAVTEEAAPHGATAPTQQPQLSGALGS